MARICNFNAGPAALPLPVLERAQAEMVDYAGHGMSVMELSHRAKSFMAIVEQAEGNIRQLMGVPDDYDILFLQGGASLQFAMFPLNLRPPGQAGAYVNTGSWASKAIKEGKITGETAVVWDGKAENYTRAPRPDEIAAPAGAAYLHICSNETIGGIRFSDFPEAGDVPLLADMSSEIMSRVVDVRRFGMIYAGAQKNIGPSGLALVIIRKDLVARCPETVPVFLRYATHAAEHSLYNTPNTWGIYITKLVTEWMLDQGGIPAIQQANEAKAAALYAVLDGSRFWRPVAQSASRSIMNVCWRLASSELEERFVKEATAAGMEGLKGHRSVGGIRASLYNAVPRACVETLIAFMGDFERRHG
ncbi:MAG TPA: 3-phosphoserine/phosphohydroxythreonine transaminase [Armatimonadota bacterium]|nr:3-phosphoserine/phosphohydroxythreonine transaminase [Armatimonadota bacterium]HOS43870.1 3-phosphoserine/phosphohydroxythreonine transaminase [Armatimonadota bacterium]